MKTVKLQAPEIPTQNYFSASFINDPAWAIHLWVIPEGGWMGGGMREGQGAGVSPMWDGAGEGGEMRLPPADGGWARLGLGSRSLWHWGHKLLPARELPYGAWGGCTLGMGPLRYQPLSATLKPFRGNAVSLLLSVCGLGTRERSCCYMNTSNYTGFVFIQLLAFWNILGKKICHDCIIHQNLDFIKHCAQ